MVGRRSLVPGGLSSVADDPASSAATLPRAAAGPLGAATSVDPGGAVPRWARASKRRIEPATAAFSEPTAP